MESGLWISEIQFFVFCTWSGVPAWKNLGLHASTPTYCLKKNETGIWILKDGPSLEYVLKTMKKVFTKRTKSKHSVQWGPITQVITCCVYLRHSNRKTKVKNHKLWITVDKSFPNRLLMPTKDIPLEPSFPGTTGLQRYKWNKVAKQVYSADFFLLGIQLSANILRQKSKAIKFGHMVLGWFIRTTNRSLSGERFFFRFVESLQWSPEVDYPVWCTWESLSGEIFKLFTPFGVCDHCFLEFERS